MVRFVFAVIVSGIGFFIGYKLGSSAIEAKYKQAEDIRLSLEITAEEQRKKLETTIRNEHKEREKICKQIEKEERNK